MDTFSVIVQTLTALAIVFAAWQLLFHSRQMHRDFELLYVQRYWELMDRRSAAFALEHEATAEDRLVIRAYLQLCEDETDLRGLGRVTDNTWRFWARSIVDQCAAPAYARELEQLDQGTYPILRRLVSSRAAYDPLAHRWFWRKVHGL